MLNKSSKIFVSGHTGLVGSSILRNLKKEGYNNLLTRSSLELDLRNQGKVESFFKKQKPEFVILAAAKVGGIKANNQKRGEFIYDNLMIQNNVINSSFKNNVKKLIFLGSSCIYPKNSKQPIKEEYLLSGKLEETNKPYAIAKIAGLEMCSSYRKQYGSNFISLMPTNLYGPNDNYDLNNSHVLPALVRKFCEAKFLDKKEVEIWGSGKPRREFMHVDDLSSACLFVLKNYDGSEILNVGTGVDITISELALMISNLVGYKGNIVYNTSMPDGTFQKLLDCSKLKKLGWEASISLKSGLKKVIKDYILNNH